MKNKKEILKEFVWGGIHPFFYHPFISYFTPDLSNKTILDCGCGKGINGYLIRVTRDLSGSEIIGLDANEDYISFCKSHNVYDRYMRHYLPTLPFKDRSIDFIICTEVIEHLDKKDGWKLLKEIDRVCRGKALVTTPNVSFQTEKNQYEDDHHSLWTVDDFRRHGYLVRGIGAKVVVLQGNRFYHLKQALNYMVTPFSFFIPEVGGFLICVKEYA